MATVIRSATSAATKPTKSMPKKISQEEARALFEKAQAVRKKRFRIKRRKGKCSVCHNAPPRPGSKECRPCHSRINIASRRRLNKARRKAEELAAKEARRREREKRKLAKAGENAAYLEFLH